VKGGPKTGYFADNPITSVKVHPQLNNNGHLVDGALVGAGSLTNPSNS